LRTTVGEEISREASNPAEKLALLLEEFDCCCFCSCPIAFVSWFLAGIDFLGMVEGMFTSSLASESAPS
jgi:hypothetical protein